MCAPATSRGSKTRATCICTHSPPRTNYMCLCEGAVFFAGTTTHIHTHIHIHSHTQHASTSPHTHVPQDEWSLDRTVSLAGANNTHTPTTTMPSHPHVLGICGCVIVRKFLEVPTTHSYTYTYTYTLPQPTYPHIQTYQGYVVVQPYNVCRS